MIGLTHFTKIRNRLDNTYKKTFNESQFQTSVSGSGLVGFESSYIALKTGTTEGSGAKLQTSAWSNLMVGEENNIINMNKYFKLSFLLSFYEQNGGDFVVKISPDDIFGDIINRGVAIQINSNNELIGIVHDGTQKNTINTGITSIKDKLYYIEIINNVKKGTVDFKINGEKFSLIKPPFDYEVYQTKFQSSILENNGSKYAMLSTIIFEGRTDY